jgi:NAD(P)H-hydrate epimerase
MKVATVAEMRGLDGTAMEKYGIREELLMENAGQSVFFVIQTEFGIAGKKFVVFCGGGNNGGDGLVIARKLHSNGATVKAFLLGDPGKFKGASKLNYEIASKLPIEVKPIESSRSIRNELRHADAVVDAIFGTGLQRDVVGLYAKVIDLINHSGKTVFSVDIPSGVHGDTGRIMGVAVRADITVTFGLPKLGNILYPGFEFCGDLFVTHISFPPVMYDSDALQVEINQPPSIPLRDRNGHKGDFGDVLFIAGAASYFGAPYFAALSFMKAGGGYARLAAPRSMTPFIANKGSEIVFVPQEETPAGGVSIQNKDSLLELSEKMDMVVMGPGLSLEDEVQQMVRELAGEIRKPLLIDGDGITAVAQDPKVLRRRRADTILTPHPGEMARITNQPISEIEWDKIGVLQRTAENLRAAIVLKGAHSLIGYRNGRVFINMSGNPGMASAGSGDVLTGTIAAMYGMGLPLPDAVRKGVFIHGLAGDLAAEVEGEDGITAQDILEYLPLAVKLDREDLDDDLKEQYAGVSIL